MKKIVSCIALACFILTSVYSPSYAYQNQGKLSPKLASSDFGSKKSLASDTNEQQIEKAFELLMQYEGSFGKKPLEERRQLLIRAFSLVAASLIRVVEDPKSINERSRGFAKSVIYKYGQYIDPDLKILEPSDEKTRSYYKFKPRKKIRTLGTEGNYTNNKYFEAEILCYILEKASPEELAEILKDNYEFFSGKDNPMLASTPAVPKPSVGSTGEGERANEIILEAYDLYQKFDQSEDKKSSDARDSLRSAGNKVMEALNEFVKDPVYMPNLATAVGILDAAYNEHVLPVRRFRANTRIRGETGENRSRALVRDDYTSLLGILKEYIGKTDHAELAAKISHFECFDAVPVTKPRYNVPPPTGLKTRGEPLAREMNTVEQEINDAHELYLQSNKEKDVDKKRQLIIQAYNKLKDALLSFVRNPKEIRSKFYNMAADIIYLYGQMIDLDLNDLMPSQSLHPPFPTFVIPDEFNPFRFSQAALFAAGLTNMAEEQKMVEKGQRHEVEMMLSEKRVWDPLSYNDLVDGLRLSYGLFATAINEGPSISTVAPEANFSL